MNLFQTPTNLPKPRAVPVVSNEDRLTASILTGARSKAKALCTAYKQGELKGWTEVFQRVGIEPSGKMLPPFNYDTLTGFLSSWVAGEPERQRLAGIKLLEEQAKRQRRSYDAIDIPLPNELKFKPQQLKSISALIDVLYRQDLRGALIPLGTGKGKSWIAAGLALWLQRNKPEEYNSFMGLFPTVLIVTKKSVVMEFKQTLKNLGLSNIGMAVDVWSYNDLMSRKNKNFFREEIVMRFEQETKVMRFTLPKEAAPRLIILDEVQELKKEKSKRTKYLEAFLEFPFIKWVSTSATPAVTIQDTLFMSRSMGLDFGGQPLTRDKFPEFARTLTLGADPTKPNVAALTRWSAYLGDRFIKPPNDPRTTVVTNRVKLFKIVDPVALKMVNSAMDNYREAIARQGRVIDPRGEIMVSFMIMARAVELATVDTWVEDSIAAHKQGLAPVLALRFIESLKDYVMKLCESSYFKELGYTSKNISLIWGGSAEIKQEDLLTPERAGEITKLVSQWVLSGETKGMPKAEDLGIEPKEYRAFKKGIKYTSERLFREMSKEAFSARNDKLRAMHLHNQNAKERYASVQAFLNGSTEFCCYTLSSGGTGISLDHRFTYTRPRLVMSTLTYWSEEFSQALGRCDRLTTLSDTLQEIYIPQDTLISDHMAPKLAQKLKSINAIGSSNVDLAAELEVALKKKEAGRKLTEEEAKGIVAVGDIEETEDEDDEDEDEAV
jgi:hypothetical protein